MQKKVTIRAVGLMLSGLLVVGVASAAEQGFKAQAEQTSVNFQGVQVAIDPATGRLIAPTAVQRAALSKAMGAQSGAAGLRTAAGKSQRPRTEAEALKTLKRSSTGRYAASMQVPDSLMSGLVAERQLDGSITIHHQDEAISPVAPAPVAHTVQEAIR